MRRTSRAMALLAAAVWLIVCGALCEAAPTVDTFYADGDGDGYGDPFSQARGTAAPTGFVANSLDYDDSNPTEYLGCTPVPGVCTPPVSAAPAGTFSAAQVDVGDLVKFSVVGSDADGDNFIFAVNGIPATAGFSSASGDFNWSPVAGEEGTYGLNLQVLDENAFSSPVRNFQLTVGGSATPITGFETRFGDLDEDTYGDPFNQLRQSPGDPLPPSYVLNADDWNDGDSQEHPGCTPGPNCHPPTSTPPSFLFAAVTLPVDQTLNLDVSAGDPDGDDLTLGVNGLPTTASFPLNPAGSAVTSGKLTWTPQDGDTGIYPLEFLAIDENGLATPILLSIQVVPAPLANFDGDTDVDGDDFLIWQRGYGLTGQTDNSLGDANFDGTVNGADRAVWEDQYGTVAPLSAASSAVPEPSSALLALMAALAIATRSGLLRLN